MDDGACRPGALTGPAGHDVNKTPREGTGPATTPGGGTGPTGGNTVSAEISLPWGKIARTVTFLPDTNSIRIMDEWRGAGGGVVTRWKFAPGLSLAESGTAIRVSSGAGPVLLKPGQTWTGRSIYNPPADLAGKVAPDIEGLRGVPLDAIVSPAFRALAAGSYLKLESDAAGPFELVISPG